MPEIKTSPPATASFHSFPLLPWELRDSIWGFAIRPRRPGAHFFTIYETEREPQMDAQAIAMDKNRYDSKYHLTGPTRTGPSPEDVSWAVDNPSAYLEDGGLWTACKESRAKMEKHYRQKEYIAAEMKRDNYDYDKVPAHLTNAPDTASFSSGGSPWCFTTFPATDLYCFRPTDMANFDIVGLKEMWLHSPWTSGHEIHHMALEYNPDWEHQMHETEFFTPSGRSSARVPNAGSAAEAAAKAFTFNGSFGLKYGAPLTLWFIDYRLKPVTSLEDCITGKERVFYGRGCRFIEVITAEDAPKYRWDCPGEDKSVEWWIDDVIYSADDEWEDYMGYLDPGDPWVGIPDRTGENYDYAMFVGAPVLWGILACVWDTCSLEQAESGEKAAEDSSHKEGEREQC